MGNNKFKSAFELDAAPENLTSVYNFFKDKFIKRLDNTSTRDIFNIFEFDSEEEDKILFKNKLKTYDALVVETINIVETFKYQEGKLYNPIEHQYASMTPMALETLTDFLFEETKNSEIVNKAMGDVFNVPYNIDKDLSKSNLKFMLHVFKCSILITSNRMLSNYIKTSQEHNIFLALSQNFDTFLLNNFSIRKEPSYLKAFNRKTGLLNTTTESGIGDKFKINSSNFIYGRHPVEFVISIYNIFNYVIDSNNSKINLENADENKLNFINYTKDVIAKYCCSYIEVLSAKYMNSGFAFSICRDCDTLSVHRIHKCFNNEDLLQQHLKHDINVLLMAEMLEKETCYECSLDKVKENKDNSIYLDRLKNITSEFKYPKCIYVKNDKTNQYVMSMY